MTHLRAVSYCIVTQSAEEMVSILKSAGSNKVCAVVNNNFVTIDGYSTINYTLVTPFYKDDSSQGCQLCIVTQPGEESQPAEEMVRYSWLSKTLFSSGAQWG